LPACEERLLIAWQDPGGEQKPEGAKAGAKSRDEMLFILTPDF
jgi:hypothetical protein